MKLTYTIEVDVERDHGPNVKKDRVSAAVIHDLIRYFSDYEVSVQSAKRYGEDTDLIAKDVVVWPHEDSVPNRMAMQNNQVVDRIPTTQPIEHPA